MSLPNQVTNLVGAAVGTAGVTFPWWHDFVAFLTGTNQVLIQIGGLLVIVMTLWKLALEMQVARRRLKDQDGGR